MGSSVLGAAVGLTPTAESDRRGFKAAAGMLHVGGMKNNFVSVGGLRALGFSFVLAVLRAQATDYYVSTSGSDSNPGPAAQPFRTITYAYSRATAGTTIYVAPGTYTDYTNGWGIHLGSSGKSSSPSGLNAQYAPKVFILSVGTHQLIVRGREGNCQLGQITIAPTP